MSVFDPVAFTTFFLKNDDFVPFEVTHDFCLYGSTAYSRGAHSHFFSIVEQINFVKGNLAPFFVLQTMYEKLLVFRNFKLLPCYLYNCVHSC